MKLPLRALHATRHPRLLLVTMVLCALGSPRDARADIVKPPPTDCPHGSIPQSSHSGPFCWVPAPCKSDEGCKTFEGDAKSPLVCRSTALCVRQKAIHRKSGGKTDVPEATASCEGAATCELDSQCERADRCAPPKPGAPTAAPSGSAADAGRPPPPDAAASPSEGAGAAPQPHSSCFCSAPGAGAPSLPTALAATALAAAAYLRRRRRRYCGQVASG